MSASQQAHPWRSAYIVRPWYDWVFFLLPPVAALWLGMLLSGTRWADELFVWSGQHMTVTTLTMGVFIHAHLVIVLFRSHGNRAVLRQHPYRFTLVPGVLLVGMLLSPMVAVTASVLATFWDVYHSGAQTFGFARIYDAKCGNDPHQGRRLDFLLNQLLYAGPIIAGATMMDHFEDFMEYEAVKMVFFTRIPAFMEGNQAIFARVIIGLGTAFVAYYLWAQWRMARQGRTICWQKVYLLASTGLVSVYTWGFNTWGEAFLIMNLFHALQYFGIVWASENRNMQRTFRLTKIRGGRLLTWVLFVGLAVGYGLMVEAWADGRSMLWWSFTIVISLMHFWYDGFVWSVRKATAGR